MNLSGYSYKKLDSKCNNLLYNSSCCFRAITINNVIIDSQSESTKSKNMLSGNQRFLRLHKRSFPANCSFNAQGFRFSTWRSPFCIDTDHMLTHLVPRAFPSSWGGMGGGRSQSREGKSPGNKVEAKPILVINYHVHMIPIQRVKIRLLLERCLEFEPTEF